MRLATALPDDNLRFLRHSATNWLGAGLFGACSS